MTKVRVDKRGLAQAMGQTASRRFAAEVERYARELLPLLAPEGFPEANIVIRFRKYVMDGEADGSCRAVDGRYEVTLCNDLKPTRLASSIAHELRHVEQYASGRLAEAPGEDGCLWRGQLVEPDDPERAPWEIEAREAERLATQAECLDV